MKNALKIFPLLPLALLVSGCSSDNRISTVADSGEPAVTVRDTLVRTSAMMEIDGRKIEVEKIYVQQRLIFAFTPTAAKPYEMLDSNSLLVGRMELHLNRLEPGVYRLDGDGSINKIADGAQSALVAWNDDKAWVAPKPAKFESDGSGVFGIGVGGL